MRPISHLFCAMVAFFGLAPVAHAETLERYDGSDMTLEAARKFTEAAYTGDVLHLFSKRASQALVQQRPELANYYGTIVDFYREEMPLEKLQAHMATLYAERFTTDELVRMREFYKTETGRKALVSTPGFLQAAANWIVEETRNRQGRLVEMLKDRREAREGDADN